MADGVVNAASTAEKAAEAASAHSAALPGEGRQDQAEGGRSRKRREFALIRRSVVCILDVPA